MNSLVIIIPVVAATLLQAGYPDVRLTGSHTSAVQADFLLQKKFHF